MRNVRELLKLSFKKRFFTVNSRLSVGALSESQIKCAMYIKRKQQKKKQLFQRHYEVHCTMIFLFLYNLILS